MRIDRIYAPVETLGPGKRIVVWAQGCSKACKGCSNPELWDPHKGQEIPEKQLATLLIDMAHRSNIDRITFSGGDPLEQPEALLELLRNIRPHFCDILIYSGFTLKEVEHFLEKRSCGELLQFVDALIDGRYLEEKNDGVCALRGSTNQTLHLFTDSLRSDYEEAMAKPRSIQNAVFNGRSISIGIHTT